VGSVVVVVGDEAVELGLELFLGGWGVLAGEEPFEGLVESFDLAAGLGVVGPGVLGGDPEGQQLGLHGSAVVASGRRGEDRPVVGQERGGISPLLSGSMQGAHDIGGSCGGERPALHAQPGVVINDVEDLEHDAVEAGDVGDVGLPALVGELSFEPAPGALGAFVGLGSDEPTGFEDPPDRRDRRDIVAAAGQVGVDGGGPGVEAGVDQLFAQLDDRVLVTVSDPCRARVRATRSWLEPSVAFGPVAGQELVEPAAVAPRARPRVRRWADPCADVSRSRTGPCPRRTPKPTVSPMS
jgi:hypothetical protein